MQQAAQVRVVVQHQRKHKRFAVTPLPALDSRTRTRIAALQHAPGRAHQVRICKVHFCRSFGNQAVASFSSFSLHRPMGAHRLPLRVCGRCIGSFSIHAALLPPYHAWLNGAHAKRSLPCTGVPYAAWSWRKAERHTLLASPHTPPPVPQMTW